MYSKRRRVEFNTSKRSLAVASHLLTESNYTTDIGAVSLLTMIYIQLHGKNGVLHRDMIV